MSGKPDQPEMHEALVALVPCFNAGHRVRPVVEALVARVAHVIVVDDGSTDGGVDALRHLPIEVIVFPRNRGKGEALLEGFRAALADPRMLAVAVVDADGQHDPAELPGLFQEFIERNADLVIGSRAFALERVPWRSRVGNILTRALTCLVLGRDLPDTQSGYRLHSRRLLEHVVAHVAGGRYETEMEILIVAVRHGFHVVPAPIQTIYEAGNPSSHFHKIRDSFLIYRRLMRTALRTRAHRR